MKLSNFFPQHFFRRAQHHFQVLFRAICVSVVGTSLELIMWAQGTGWTAVIPTFKPFQNKNVAGVFMHEYWSIVRLTCTISSQALSATNQLGPRAPKATKSPRDKEHSFSSEEYKLHMDKRSSSRWLLVSVQRAATLIKRNDSFIHDTKKSNVIADISRCYSFKSGQRGKFPFHKRVAAILRHSEKFWPVIESRVLLKKKEDRKPPADQDLSYPTLSPLPAHYHTDP